MPPKSVVSIAVLILVHHCIFSQVSYIPDESLRNSIRNEVWQELKTHTPKKHRFLMSLVFNSNEPFTSYKKAAKQRGWEPYELATAASFFQIICNEVVGGMEFSENKYKEEYGRIAGGYKIKNIDAELNQKEKQKKYDALILKAFWVASIFELEKKKSPEIQELAEQLLSKNLIANGSPASVSESKTSSVPSPKPVTSPIQEINNTGEIADIILRTVTSYGLNGVYVDNQVNVLYRNGDVFTNPSKPLESFDIVKSKRTKPNQWDKWKKKGNIIYVTRSKNGKVYDWKKWFDVRPGNKGFKLSGKFNTSDAFGGATVVNASTVYFDQQGRFAWKTIKGGNTVWRPAFVKSNSAGTYDISKHTITLKYNNGVSESFFFGLYPKDNKHFIIGVSHFVPTKE